MVFSWFSRCVEETLDTGTDKKPSFFFRGSIFVYNVLVFDLFFNSQMKRNVFGNEDSEESDNENEKRMRSKAQSAQLRGLVLENSVKSDDEEDYMDFSVDANDRELEVHEDGGSGLQQSLFATNKDSIGLKMMYKMGYSTGSTLGRRDNGLAEPLEVTIKLDKRGIGAKTNESSFSEPIPDYTGYTASNSAKYKVRHQRSLLENLQKVAFNLSGDADAFHGGNVEIESVHPLWREYSESLVSERVSEKVSERKSEKELESQIVELVDYLRAHFNYCYFCGCEISSDCPGPYEEDHT